MHRFTLSVALTASAFACISCGASSSPASETSKLVESKAAPLKLTIPPDVQSTAEVVLGNEAEVLAYGDLAKTGNDQALAINRLKAAPPGTVPGTLITRLAIVEKTDGQWKEIPRCDEHLKNIRGYLGGTPLAGVPAWQLRYERDPVKGLTLYFTPLAKPAGGHIQTVGVRWNAKAGRYESLDQNYEGFLKELAQLETSQSVLR